MSIIKLKEQKEALLKRLDREVTNGSLVNYDQGIKALNRLDDIIDKEEKHVPLTPIYVDFGFRDTRVIKYGICYILGSKNIDDIVNEITKLVSNKKTTIYVDDIGYGQVLLDRLKSLGYMYVIPLKFEVVE